MYITVGVVAAVAIAILGAVVLVRAFKVLGFLIAHVARFIGGMFSDTFRFVGAVVLMIVLAPMVLLSVVIGRWSAAAHYGRAVKNEIKTAVVSLYRVGIGHPLRLIGLAAVTEGLEQRLPQVIAEAPGADKPSKRRVGMFDGYTIVGSLPGGGSGGRLYIAEPNELKLAAFARRGLNDVEQVVIKSFSLTDGSSLPQIVRESRALDAAKKLGLVLEHELTDERFFYVMKYVPGESLSTLTTRWHGLSSSQGLDDHYLRDALGYIADLLRALETYHSGGLWHKDVKPDNIIVDGSEAHLVDFGLVTPLRSAMTLTTHGTEYFRDPELVRQALRGVKVHQIDGSKFDIYAAGAVLYSVLENSFPAHGGLSQITKRCPEAVRWIVRRAMTDYDKRYATAGEMLSDLETVLAADDPFAVRPADLPSVKHGGTATELPRHDWDPAPIGAAAAGTPVPPAQPAQERAVPKRLAGRPKLHVTGWWSGKYELVDEHTAGTKASDDDGGYVAVAGLAGARPFFHAGQVGKDGLKQAVDRAVPKARASAAEQLRSARARAAARRRAAQQRVSSMHRRLKNHRDPAAINAGVVAGVVFAMLLFAVLGAGALLVVSGAAPSRSMSVAINDAEPPRPAEPPMFGSSLSVSSPPAADSPLPASLLSAVENRSVLLVSDLTPPIDKKVNEAVASVVSKLVAAGTTLLGDGTLFGADSGEDDASQIALVAELEAARGQRPIDAPDLHTVVRAWLGDHNDVDAVLWICPAGPDRKGIQYCALTTNSMVSGHADTLIAEELTDAVASVCSTLN